MLSVKRLLLYCNRLRPCRIRQQRVLTKVQTCRLNENRGTMHGYGTITKHMMYMRGLCQRGGTDCHITVTPINPWSTTTASCITSPGLKAYK